MTFTDKFSFNKLLGKYCLQGRNTRNEQLHLTFGPSQEAGHQELREALSVPGLHNPGSRATPIARECGPMLKLGGRSPAAKVKQENVQSELYF